MICLLSFHSSNGYSSCKLKQCQVPCRALLWEQYRTPAPLGSPHRMRQYQSNYAKIVFHSNRPSRARHRHVSVNTLSTACITTNSIDFIHKATPPISIHLLHVPVLHTYKYRIPTRTIAAIPTATTCAILIPVSSSSLFCFLL